MSDSRKSHFVITGGQPLAGEVRASGNKNAALPMIAASLLTDQPVVLENVPRIRDVEVMLEIVEHLGVDWHFEGPTLQLQARDIRQPTISRRLCRAVRTSFLFVAPLLHRCGSARVYAPGGDIIGRRRLDAHFYGLRRLGAEIEEDRFSFAAPHGLQGQDLFFDEASVTATEHIMMAAVLASGETIIRNAASEPHVQDLARLLIGMGGDIDGVNTNTLVIRGTQALHGTTHRVVPDHIETGSFLALAAATGGSITVHDAVRSHYWMINRVFERFGITLEFGTDCVSLRPGQRPRVTKDLGGAIPRVDDGPWPQFPSDLMSTMMVLATQSEGTVLFFEKMYESRMYFVDRLIQMGASAVVCDPHRVVVSGRTMLRGQAMSSPDIRAGMALIGAALCARGPSIVDNAWIIDRGYEALESKLQAIGARIDRRVGDPAYPDQ